MVKTFSLHGSTTCAGSYGAERATVRVGGDGAARQWGEITERETVKKTRPPCFVQPRAMIPQYSFCSTLEHLCDMPLCSRGSAVVGSCRFFV